MDEYRMLDNIRHHSIVVARIAHLIARELVDSSVDISVEKTAAGALLHDIGKTLCLNNGGDHAALGREICLHHQLDEIADIVGEHVRLKNFVAEKQCSEKEIVYYADKRVNHTSVVALEDRLHYILERYGRNNSLICRRIHENFAVCKSVQSKLFARLDFRPEDVAGILQDRTGSGPRLETVLASQAKP